MFLIIENSAFVSVMFVFMLQTAYNQYASNCWPNLLLGCIREGTDYWAWIWVVAALFLASSSPH